MNNYVKIDDYKCPFGERDLSPLNPAEPYGARHDECYLGNGVHRCKYFVRYDWEKHYGCIVCTHPAIKNEPEQLEFDF